MKKLILGIAGIVVLDLAFIFALIGADDSTELAAVALPLPVSLHPRFPQMSIADSAPIEEPDAAIQAKPVRNSTLSKDYSTKSFVRTKGTRDNHANETPARNFKNTIIWYQGPDRENNRQFVASVTAKNQSEPIRKKKNVVSRAFSISKKPFDWVKSIASKL